MKWINKIRRTFKPRRLTISCVFAHLGKRIEIGGGSQLVTNVDIAPDEDGQGYTIKIQTMKGDWRSEIYT